MTLFKWSIFNLLKKYPSKKFVYLASDVHNYQHIEFYNITQYIAGTGGAHLDDIDETAIGIHDEKYNIISTNKCYGYSTLEYDGTSLSHMFQCVWFE